MAVKKLRKVQQKEGPIKDILNECSALQSLRHPNIVMFLGCNTKNFNSLCIIMEYCPYDSLWNMLRNQEVKMDWKKKYKIALGIALGMNYLHTF